MLLGPFNRGSAISAKGEMAALKFYREVRIWISICTTMALIEGPKQAILEALMTRGRSQ
jgi:hypothetical protein